MFHKWEERMLLVPSKKFLLVGYFLSFSFYSFRYVVEQCPTKTLTTYFFLTLDFYFLTLDGFRHRRDQDQDINYFFLFYSQISFLKRHWHVTWKINLIMQLLEQAQSLLNFDGQTTFDVNVLDAVINTMYRGQGDAVSTSFKVLLNRLFWILFSATTSKWSIKCFTWSSWSMD